MPRSTSRPGDLTGRVREQQARAHAEDLAAREDALAVAYALEQDALENEVEDLTGPVSRTLHVSEVEEVDEVEATSEVVIPIEDIDNVTVGAGNHFSLKAGKKTLVPKFVADHLREKGYLR